MNGKPWFKTAFVAACLALGAQAQAGTVLLTMDEVSTQLIDGLTVTKGGESFTFANAGRTLFYNSTGPGNRTYVNDPTIQGATSAFSVDFSEAVDNIQFGMAESAGTAMSVQVTLFEGASVVGTFPLTLGLIDPFAEGQFNWSGGAVTSMSIAPDTRAPAIAFDNLKITTAVPEPASLGLFAIGLAGLAGLTKRRRS